MKKLCFLLLVVFGIGVGMPDAMASTAAKTTAKTASGTQKATAKKKVTVKKKAATKTAVKAAAKKTNDTESGEADSEDAQAKKYESLLLGDTKGNIFIADNIDERWPLASVTKMMTLLVTFDEIKKGNISLSDDVTITQEANNVGGSKIAMKTGEVYSLEDLIKAAGIYSANNAAYAIAIYVGGSVDDFVKMMNAKARELGLGNELTFYTPAGLPTHMTKKKMDVGTARGIYKLSIEAAKNTKLMSIASTERTTIHGGKIALRNRNKLLGKDGIYGIKTGYHTKSKYNISVVSDRDNMKLITVVFGGKTYKERDNTVLATVDNFYENFAYKEIIAEDKPLVKIPVLEGEKEYVELYPESSLTKLVNINDKINIKVKRMGKVVAPVKEGEILGSYSVYIADKVVAEGELKATEDIKLKSQYKTYSF